ncbi:MAG: hypothetical protein EOM24_12385, partial [Chloroflexia bacterium]|nr:hypothetical protein [Chloroflexia bacterium]
MTTRRGQQLFLTTLIPEGATMRLVDPAEDNVGTTVATDEPMTQRIVVTAPDAASVRFLHVLEGADGGASATEATLLQSNSGTPYEGVVVGAVAVLFPVTAGQSFASLRYTVPATIQEHLITGLMPGGAY